MTYAQIYAALIRARGFPSSPQFAQWMKRDASIIADRNRRSELGAMHESHIRDCTRMAVCVANSRADLLPAAMIETD